MNSLGTVCIIPRRGSGTQVETTLDTIVATVLPEWISLQLALVFEDSESVVNHLQLLEDLTKEQN